jgi:hypothetical protein
VSPSTETFLRSNHFDYLTGMVIILVVDFSTINLDMFWSDQVYLDDKHENLYVSFTLCIRFA